MELIPGLPEDLAIECLIRVHHSALPASNGVSHGWHQFLGSPEFYHIRKREGHTYLVAILVQSITGSSCDHEPATSPCIGITMFDPVSQTWERVDLGSGYINGLPLYCQVASLEGKLVIMGGWDPVSCDLMRDVSIYDFTTQQWIKGKDMPTKLTLFAIGGLNRQVFVAGGHDLDKNASKLAWAYNLLEDEWTELAPMSEDRDECQGTVVGSEFWVVSGYDTKSQGRFKPSADVYNIETGQWRWVDEAWIEDQSPRLSAGLQPKGELRDWAKLNSSSEPWTFAIDLEEQILVYKSESPQFMLLNKQKHRNGNDDYDFEILEVPDEFLGYVQSGCYAKI